MMLFNIHYRFSSFKNEVNIQQKNSTFNINSMFNEKINVQLVKSAFNKNSMFNEIFQYSTKFFNI